MTSFSDLDLAEPLARALTDSGYTEPTPIQAQAIPHLMGGRDLLGIAQTGTGKTAAFALPTLHHIFTDEIDPPKRGARALVLAPTRELVGQIAESFQTYGRHMMQLSVARVTGGVPIGKQIKRLVHGNDVLVATPGRLIDLLDRKAITLAEVEVLILDEADQMMDMGFIHALRKIVPLLPKKRQTVFLSATMVPKIKKLADSFLTDPISVSVAPANTTAERVTQTVIFTKPADKPMLIADQLLQPDVERALVFMRTKHGSDRLVKRLMKVGLPAVTIHGNKSQGQRTRALDAFKSGKVNILVATDVAARGIDIPNITHVFNYELPNVPEQYVHRIGRTARANASGKAIALVSPDERSYLKDIQRLLKEKIPVTELPVDLSARFAEISARAPADPVDIAAKEQPRKGRGKSRNRRNTRPGSKNGESGARKPGRREREKARQERGGGNDSNARDRGPRPDSRPDARPESKPDSPRSNTRPSAKKYPVKKRFDGDGERPRNRSKDTHGKKPYQRKTDGDASGSTERRPAPVRRPKGENNDGKSGAGFARKPRRDGPKGQSGGQGRSHGGGKPGGYKGKPKGKGARPNSGPNKAAGNRPPKRRGTSNAR